MRNWTGRVVILTLALILLISYSLIGKDKSVSSKKQSAYEFFNSEQASASNTEDGSVLSKSKAKGPTIFHSKVEFREFEGLDELYSLSTNITKQYSNILLVWSEMRSLFTRSDALPETGQGIKEGLVMWKDLLLMIKEDDDGSEPARKDCPHFVTASGNESFVEIPCGLVEDSSVTIIGIPDSREVSFEIELTGSQLKEEIEPPIVLQYKVVLPGNNLTKEPLSIQNTWTPDSGWGTEEKCPHHDSSDLQEVDGLVKCNTQMFPTHSANRKLSSNVSGGSKDASPFFHILEGNPFTATIWSGNVGFHMTVNGRHETSFAYRERLEPWLVSKVRWRGGLTVLSVIAKGLPVNEELDLATDAQRLKAVPIPKDKKLLLLIGVFSSGNNFARRLALRRSWMQYDAVRSGEVAVRFFIGLHRNKEVNFNLWKEAEAYGDIQLMPLVDYYGLLTYKTIAICMMGADILPAKYIMKMDDDAFVRIDEIVSSLEGKPVNGLLYGRISFESAPHRDEDNKWFVREEEWAQSSYPPWAHGPGYVISRDVAKFIVEGHKKMKLMMFKLEDVAVGIWLEQLKEKGGEKIEYVNENRFNNAGCEADYILAHYQSPRKILCLWEKLQKQHKAECCE